MTKVVPRFFASGSQEGARGWSSAKRSAAAAEARVAVPECTGLCGRAQASTAGLQHAPSGHVDAVERVTRGLRIEGLAAAAASTFSRGSLSLLDRLPPPPSSARTARPYLPTTHGVEHGEWRGEHRAVVGLAGTVGGEQQGRTQDASGRL